MFKEWPRWGTPAVIVFSITVFLCFVLLGTEAGSKMLGSMLIVTSGTVAAKAIKEWNNWPLADKPEWKWKDHVEWRTTLVTGAFWFFIGGLAVYNWLPILLQW